MIKIEILTIFPEQLENFLQYSIPAIAVEKQLVEIKVHNLRKWTTDKHQTVDDRPFGGGAGMLMKVEPVYNALKDLRQPNTVVIATTPRGEKLTQSKLREFSSVEDAHYIILCGHYEGFDERILENLVDLQISVGDYVLSGGELPALIIVDGIIRLIPGVLGNSASTETESFENNLLEHPHYTRPEEFNGWKVPEILLSGDHKKIEQWRQEKSKAITDKHRPDLISTK